MQTSISANPDASDRRFRISEPAELPQQPSADPAKEPSPAAHSPSDVSSRFGLRLRELRRERNLTQLRMANDFGIDRSFISDVERGRKSISLPMLEIIALGMKLTLSDLLKDI
jgi:DNA-binding XRE family transcriptional regulator